MNNCTVDAKIKPDVTVLNEIATFNVSFCSGTFQLPSGETRDRYTAMKVIYDGEMDSSVVELLQPGRVVRLIGKLDSEMYRATSGKNVFNKVLKIHTIKPVRYDKTTQQYVLVEEGN